MNLKFRVHGLLTLRFFSPLHHWDYAPLRLFYYLSVHIGKGIVDWKEFFASLKKGGVKNIFVEMDPETLEDTAKFLNGK
jgi:hypothetical protein